MSSPVSKRLLDASSSISNKYQLASDESKRQAEELSDAWEKKSRYVIYLKDKDGKWSTETWTWALSFVGAIASVFYRLKYTVYTEKDAIAAANLNRAQRILDLVQHKKVNPLTFTKDSSSINESLLAISERIKSLSMQIPSGLTTTETRIKRVLQDQGKIAQDIADEWTKCTRDNIPGMTLFCELLRKKDLDPEALKTYQSRIFAIIFQEISHPNTEEYLKNHNTPVVIGYYDKYLKLKLLLDQLRNLGEIESDTEETIDKFNHGTEELREHVYKLMSESITRRKQSVEQAIAKDSQRIKGLEGQETQIQTSRTSIERTLGVIQQSDQSSLSRFRSAAASYQQDQKDVSQVEQAAKEARVAVQERFNQAKALAESTPQQILQTAMKLQSEPKSASLLNQENAKINEEYQKWRIALNRVFAKQIELLNKRKADLTVEHKIESELEKKQGIFGGLSKVFSDESETKVLQSEIAQIDQSLIRIRRHLALLNPQTPLGQSIEKVMPHFRQMIADIGLGLTKERTEKFTKNSHSFLAKHAGELDFRERMLQHKKEMQNRNFWNQLLPIITADSGRSLKELNLTERRLTARKATLDQQIASTEQRIQSLQSSSGNVLQLQAEIAEFYRLDEERRLVTLQFEATKLLIARGNAPQERAQTEALLGHLQEILQLFEDLKRQTQVFDASRVELETLRRRIDANRQQLQLLQRQQDELQRLKELLFRDTEVQGLRRIQEALIR